MLSADIIGTAAQYVLGGILAAIVVMFVLAVLFGGWEDKQAKDWEREERNRKRRERYEKRNRNA